MSNANGMNKDSGHQEWYTPSWLIERVRRFYDDKLDLDPASDESANQMVGADTFYTREDDGLQKEWFGNVWLNHPYGRKENDQWSNKIIHARWEGADQVTGICYASTSEKWCNRIITTADVICFISGRIKFIDARTGEPGGSSQKGSMIYYYGPEPKKFVRNFDGVLSPDGKHTGICLERAW